jgi:hypothetical protein
MAQLSEDELSSMLMGAPLSLEPSPMYITGLVMQERIRRHALVCQDLECGFTPWG